MFRPQRTAHSQSLDLIPIMNLVSILIPFLLLGASFVNLAVVETEQPAIGEADPMVEPPALNLVVAITPDGIAIHGADGALDGGGEGVDIACAPACVGADGYDYDRLTRLLGQVKDEHPNHEALVLQPDGRVPYEVLVGVMDAARAESMDQGGRILFPHQVVAGGR